MIDPSMLLNVPPGASLEEIRSAYYQKRAALMALSADDLTVPEQMQELESAYNQLAERFKPATVTPGRVEQPGNSMLNLVDSLDTPIQLRTAAGAMKACPNCSALNPDKATICQACGFQMAKACPNCGDYVPRDLADCPRCGTVLNELHQTRLAEAEVSKNRTYRERDQSDIYINTLEAEHTERRKFGILFWALVFFLIIGLCGFAMFAPVLMRAIFGQQ
jgi:RNA polymerase subunit RPABC4/transcription elongation factor Spt4